MYKELKIHTTKRDFIEKLLEHKPEEYTVIYYENIPVECRISFTNKGNYATIWTENKIIIRRYGYEYQNYGYIEFRPYAIEYMAYVHNGKAYMYESQPN